MMMIESKHIKKILLYGVVLIGLGGFGFTQNGCNTDNDCSVNKIQSCCGEGTSYQCSNKQGGKNPRCSVIECASKSPTLQSKVNLLLKKPPKFKNQYDCKCQQYQCKDVSAGEYINPLWIGYIAIKIIILSIGSIGLGYVGYYIYSKHKNKKTQI